MDFKKNLDTDFKDLNKLSEEEAKEEIEALREGIEYHDYLYYVKNKPAISDAVYDKLFRRLQDLEEAFPQFQTDNSPTQRVGAEPLDKLKKVKHTVDMLSLNAVLEKGEVKDYIDFIYRNLDKGEEVSFVLEPKFDGLSVELVYEGGSLSYGATRGNGRVGEDVTENLKTIGSVPLKLRKTDDTPSFLAVRGEVYMPKDGFQRMNREKVEMGEEPYANPRNAAAGAMRKLEPKLVAQKPLNIFFYDILKIEGVSFKTHWEELQKFPHWGFRTDPHTMKTKSFEEIVKFHQDLAEQRDDLNYELDGIVIKVDDLGQRERLGVRQRSPRWALAWKFPPKKEVTILKDIVVQVGRTGVLTPIALLDPVDVGGVTISRATLHNEDEVRKKDVRPGDRVRIIRAGDVIPEVLEVVEHTPQSRDEKFSMPDSCPVCDSDVIKEGAYYFCTAGLSCPAQLAGRIIHYSARNALDIGGLGEKTVKTLVKKGMVKNLADIYKLDKEDFLKLEGFAEKSARQLYEAIQNSKKARLDRFLYALGIRHVGEHVALVIARHFKTLDKLRKASKDDLLEIREIGPEIADSVVNFFREEENERVLDQLLKDGVVVEDMPTEKKELPLEGLKIVFTGELENYTRNEAKKAVERLGARATSSVSKNTDYVVAGENPGSKLNQAKKHGVKILDERDFEELLRS